MQYGFLMVDIQAAVILPSAYSDTLAGVLTAFHFPSSNLLQFKPKPIFHQLHGW